MQPVGRLIMPWAYRKTDVVRCFKQTPFRNGVLHFSIFLNEIRRFVRWRFYPFCLGATFPFCLGSLISLRSTALNRQMSHQGLRISEGLRVEGENLAYERAFGSSKKRIFILLSHSKPPFFRICSKKYLFRESDFGQKSIFPAQVVWSQSSSQ